MLQMGVFIDNEPTEFIEIYPSLVTNIVIFYATLIITR